jgi:hypothetical protein
MMKSWQIAWLVVGGTFLIYAIATRPYDGVTLGLINFVLWGGVAAGITAVVSGVMHRGGQT